MVDSCAISAAQDKARYLDRNGSELVTSNEVMLLANAIVVATSDRERPAGAGAIRQGWWCPADPTLDRTARAASTASMGSYLPRMRRIGRVGRRTSLF